MNTFQLDIVSPERQLLSVQATMVLIPGAEGIFGVLPRHMNLIAEVAPGVVEVHAEQKVERFYVSQGVAQVNATSCSILVNEAFPAAEVDISALQARLERVRNDYKYEELDTARVDLQSEMTFLEKVLELHAKS